MQNIGKEYSLTYKQHSSTLFIIGLLWLIGGLFFSFTTPNPLMTLCAFALVPVIFKLLWFPGDPPILLFALGVQWLEVVMKIFHANILGLTVKEFFGHSSIEMAIWYSMGGLLVLTVGIKVVLKSWRSKQQARHQEILRKLNPNKLLIAYLITIIIGFVLIKLSWMAPSVRQILLPIIGLKWFFYFLLAYSVLSQKRAYNILIIITLFEIIVGLTQYFSAFKLVLFVLILAYLSARPRFTGGTITMITVLTMFTLILALFWTAIKMDYRYFLNRGTGQQVILRSFNERIDYIFNEIGRLDQIDIIEAANNLAVRVSYTDFFAYTIQFVPDYRPHENGKIWWSAIQHITQPRVFFPDKAALNKDSEFVGKYTGIRLAPTRHGTSTSIGYMGESYIDFGFPVMYFPIFCLGLLYGGIYRFLLSNHGHLGYAAAVVCLLVTSQFGINSVKLVGGLIMSFIVLSLWIRFAMPIIWPYLVYRRTSIL